MSTPFWMMKSRWNSTAKGHITAIEDSHRQTHSIYNRHIWESDGIQSINAQNSTSGKLIVQIRSRKACSQSHAEGTMCSKRDCCSLDIVREMQFKTMTKIKSTGCILFWWWCGTVGILTQSSRSEKWGDGDGLVLSLISKKDRKIF